MHKNERIVELWVPLHIDCEETQYEISDAGRIRNKHTKHIRKTRINRLGYEEVHLRHNGNDYTKKVHRLVANEFIPNPDNKSTVNHIAKGFINRSYNDVTNLEWATQKEQVADCIKKGTFIGQPAGENNRFANHTEEQIRAVCKLLEQNKLTVHDIAKCTGVSTHAIHKIIHKKTWVAISKYYNIDNYTISKCYPFELKNSMEQLYAAGYSYRDICNKLSIDINNKSRCLFYQITKNYKMKSSTTIENNDIYYTIDIKL